MLLCSLIKQMTGVEGGGRKRKQAWKRWQNKVKSNQFKGTQTEGKKGFWLGECAHIHIVHMEEEDKSWLTKQVRSVLFWDPLFNGEAQHLLFERAKDMLRVKTLGQICLSVTAFSLKVYFLPSSFQKIFKWMLKRIYPSASKQSPTSSAKTSKALSVANVAYHLLLVH